jgi:hypothetical protein
MKQKQQNQKTARKKIRDKDRSISELLELVQALRAQLCQLRIYNTAASSGNIGWMVSCFIPNATVAKLKEHPEDCMLFMDLVMEALVRNALKGILHKTSGGQITALLFKQAELNPKKNDRGEYELCGTVYEQSDKVFIHEGAADKTRIKEISQGLQQPQTKLIEDAK